MSLRLDFFNYKTIALVEWDQIQELEKEYTDVLAWDTDEKIDFLHGGGEGLWMRIDGIIRGEILWKKDDEYKGKKKVAYISSTTIHRKYQGKGYGRIMKLIVYQIMRDKGYVEVRGHALLGRSWKLSKSLGAKEIKLFKNWAGIGKSAILYKQKL